MALKIVKNVKDARKCDNLNDPVDNCFVDYAAMAFSQLFIKLHIIPNVVTLFSGIVGVAGGILLIFDTLWLNIAGVLLIILAAIFDASDGQVARLTKKYSTFGRILDGFIDFLVYLSIYVALCIRLYNVNIPFTDTPWGYIIILVAFVAFWFHGAQSRTVDYYKNLHMFMIKNGKGNELSRAAAVKKEVKESKFLSFKWLKAKYYLSYTGMQEKETPQTQKLLDKIEENGGVSEHLSNAFALKSRKYVKFTNILAFNLRTIVLFILLFLPGHAEFYFFPFTVFIIEPVRIILILKYEKLSKKLRGQDFFTTDSKE